MLQKNNIIEEIGTSISDLAAVKSNSLNPGHDEVEPESTTMRRKDSLN